MHWISRRNSTSSIGRMPGTDTTISRCICLSASAHPAALFFSQSVDAAGRSLRKTRGSKSREMYLAANSTAAPVRHLRGDRAAGWFPPAAGCLPTAGKTTNPKTTHAHQPAVGKPRWSYPSATAISASTAMVHKKHARRPTAHLTSPQQATDHALRPGPGASPATLRAGPARPASRGPARVCHVRAACALAPEPGKFTNL